MGTPIAKKGDPVIGVDTHIVVVNGKPTPMPVRFNGEMEDVSSTVWVDDMLVAVVGSVARDKGGHIPIGGPFLKEPAKTATVTTNDCTVFIEDARAGRRGDKLNSCSDVGEQGTSHLEGDGTVVTD